MPPTRRRRWASRGSAILPTSVRGGGPKRLALEHADPDFGKRLQDSIDRNKEILERLAG
jgi:hypothetical protein